MKVESQPHDAVAQVLLERLPQDESPNPRPEVGWAAEYLADELAAAAINATLEGDWLVEAIHRGVCEDDLEECRSEGRGHCVRAAASIREAGIRRA